MLTEISGEKCFEVLDDDKYIFFYFGASWCGPCQQVLPKLNNLSNNYDKNIIEFYKIDIDLEENKIICDKCQIKVVPNFLLFKGREFINRTKGNNIDGITNMINSVLFPEPPKLEMIQEKVIENNPYQENRKIFNKENLF
jgi:thioredoxin 1